MNSLELYLVYLLTKRYYFTFRRQYIHKERYNKQVTMTVQSSLLLLIIIRTLKRNREEGRDNRRRIGSRIFHHRIPLSKSQHWTHLIRCILGEVLQVDNERVWVELEVGKNDPSKLAYMDFGASVAIRLIWWIIIEGVEIDNVLGDYTPCALYSKSGKVVLAPVIGNNDTGNDNDNGNDNNNDGVKLPPFPKGLDEA